MPLLAALATLLILLMPASVRADTILVGPGEAVVRIADAARLARDGDTVLILPGEYRGDVAVWLQRNLTIRGVGERPVLIADGAHAEGKAIWVIRDGDFRIENIEFRGARVPDGNGAGIRFERGRLEVRDSAFLDNQNGILTANFEDAELVVRDSLFAEAPRDGTTLGHLLYVGRIARLEVRGSRFHNGHEGHLIKSRARENEIRYNLIYDGPGGGASYELEFPNGGDALVVGNVIGQSAATQNPILVAYGAEGPAWPRNRLVLSHNTLITEGLRPAWFARVWDEHFPAGIDVLTRNNLTSGFGMFTLRLPGNHAGNIPLPPGVLGDPSTLDFTLSASSSLRGLVSDARGTGRDGLLPTAEFAFPVGTSPLTPPEKWAPGAFQAPHVIDVRTDSLTR